MWKNVSFRTMAAAAILGVLLGVTHTAAARAQFPPDSLVNLKVLPETTSVRGVIGVMRGFAGGLGVRCTYCHVGEEGQPLSTYDFPSDEKRTKRVARLMLRMVQHINQERLTEIPERPADEVMVRCETCHRGSSRPKLIDEVLREAIAAGGLDSATRAYRNLREENYGRGRYDFGESRLTQFGFDYAQETSAFDVGIGLITLSLEYDPEFGRSHLYLGELYRVQDDTTTALEHYRKALDLDPNDRFARARIEQLGGN